MKEIIPVTIRPITPTEYALIYSSFAKSMRGSGFSAGCSSEALFDALTMSAAAMLAGRLGWEVVVAEVTETPGEIGGWISYRQTDHGLQIGFVYVKEDYRGFAIGTTLAEFAGATKAKPFAAVFGHPAAITDARRKGWQIRLTPFVAFDLLIKEPSDAVA